MLLFISGRSCSILFYRYCFVYGRQSLLVKTVSSSAMVSPLYLSSRPEFQQIFSPEVKVLIDVFKKHNIEIRLAGGAVRDLLQSKVPYDLDFATPATPNRMKEILDKEGIRRINGLGEKHGTITARINDKENFEITTLRIDLMTDGRHAQVEFTTDWVLDAGRRDLTINAMFLGMQDGRVYDYFNGVQHLFECRVKFVGQAALRIQEDYLRILRYFRFSGRICNFNNDQHVDDEDTLDAIKQNVKGLAGISGERIWMEWKKILSGPQADHLMRRMLDCGLATYIGLPESPNYKAFVDVYNQCSTRLEPAAYLASLLSSAEELIKLHGRLKLSCYERDLSLFIIKHRDTFSVYSDENLLYACKCVIAEASRECQPSTRKWLNQTLIYINRTLLVDRITHWELPEFQINGHDLMQAGCPRSPLLAAVLSNLKKLWMESDFVLSRDQLLARLDKVLLTTLEESPSSTPSSDSRKRRRKGKDSS